LKAASRSIAEMINEEGSRDPVVIPRPASAGERRGTRRLLLLDDGADDDIYDDDTSDINARSNMRVLAQWLKVFTLSAMSGCQRFDSP
jgi:hypothetical protein